jgi:hypothetical protein
MSVESFGTSQFDEVSFQKQLIDEIILDTLSIAER